MRVRTDSRAGTKTEVLQLVGRLGYQDLRMLLEPPVL